jgi:multiple sugar transport system permease protein/alpha-1,4-digalacturonate transport system permease protein
VDRRLKQPFWNSLKVVPYLFILPNMILFLVFMIIPVFMTGWYSLVRWNGMGTPKFIGLANYFYIFQDDVFLKSLWNTLSFTGVTVPILMALALAFAIMLNQNIHLRGFFRSAMYVPSIISTVVAGMVFIWLFNPQLGLINYLIRVAGGTAIEWSTDPRYAMVMVIVGTVWGRTGYNMVIYLAALQGIAPEYYEAAKIDGASPWQCFRYITMPMLNATHMFVLITCVIHSFRSFDLIYVMTKGGPLNATKTLVVYVYDTAFAMNYFGRAAAAGVVLFFILLAFTIVRMRSERTVL